METKAMIPAPFDGKNLSDDCLRDSVFENFYEAEDSKGGLNHFIGRIYAEDYIDCVVDAQWRNKGNVLLVRMLACPCQQDFLSMRDFFFTYYEGIFTGWENPEHSDLRVKFHREGSALYVAFYFECE